VPYVELARGINGLAGKRYFFGADCHQNCHQFCADMVFGRYPRRNHADYFPALRARKRP